MALASLGGPIEAPTIDGGRARVQIPAARRAASSSACAARGCRCCARTARATFTFEVGVETPVNLTKRQKELLEEFQTIAEKNDNSPESAGFFTQVKDFWGRMTS